MSIILRQSATLAASGLHQAPVPHWLSHLGALGLFSVAMIDSSIIPLPVPGTTDLLLLWLVAHSGDPWLLACSAIAGSLLGGFSTWQLGQKGGEGALQRHVPRLLLRRVVGWVERHPLLAVFLPALLPPPIPLSPFVLATGALGVSRNRFLMVFGTARCLRYSLIAWLAASYGRKIMRLYSGTLQKWSAPLIWTFGGLLVAGTCFGLWRLRRSRKFDAELKSKQIAKAVCTD